MPEDSRFSRLVSLACHDLRTPLATVHGFARTLARTGLDEPATRYVEMIEAASMQLADFLDDLSVVAHIESNRYQPTTVEVDSLELARSAVEELADGEVTVSGQGAAVRVEPEATRRALRQLARATLRHGAVPAIELAVDGNAVEITPVAASAAGVVSGDDLRELGPAAAVSLVHALGGSVEVAGETLTVRLPGAQA